MSTNVFFVVAIGLLIVGPAAHGGDPPKDNPDVAKLVRDLGSPRFAVREAAEKNLVQLGAKAKAAVLAGTRDSDAEVARRCKAVLPRIRLAEGKALADGTGDWPAPAGTRFKDLVGDTKEARKLFALMTGDEHRAEVADTAADNPGQAVKLYAAEVARLMEAEARATREHLRRPAGPGAGDSLADTHKQAVTPGDVALALYLGAFSSADAAADPSGVSAIPRASFFELAAGPLTRPTGRLFAGWLDRRGNPQAAQTGMEAALFADVDWASPAARRWAADKEAPAAVVGTALVVLGHHGTRDDLARLSARRGDARVYAADRLVAPGRRQLEVQVRDVAAAMSLLLRAQDLRSHGFNQVLNKTSWGRPDQPPFITPTPFRSAEARTATLSKAWEWLDGLPGAPPKPGE